MYILILVLPLISAIVSGIWGRKIGIKGAGIFSCVTLFVSFCVVLIYNWKITILGELVYIPLWTWFSSELLNVHVSLQFDSLTCIMLMVVITVSLLVHIYSTSYMSGDPHVQRFMSYLSLFTFFMVVLVSSNNFLQLFVGWEGVGLCSYLLINFWYTGIDNNKCAIKAMIVNRIGDMGLLLAMFWMWIKVGSLDFASVFSVASGHFEEWNIICILILVGAIGKSAQLGLHTWLPDAMAGPTPVSALIHAATMVTAGVFIIIRSSPIFEQADVALVVVTVVGALTAFFAATIGVLQHDIKKIVAYSTCSQLGYMILACGFSAYSTSLFHLANHAFFKALLFLSAGSVIHAITDTQDIRVMGSLRKLLPTTYILMGIGSLSLMGLPFLTGFYSKDLILELAFSSRVIGGAFWLATIAALLTAFYSFRLLYLTFLDGTKLSRINTEPSHESDWNLITPLLALALGSIFVGFISKEIVLGPVVPPMISTELKWVPTCLALVGAISAILIFYNSNIMGKKFIEHRIVKHIYSFIGNAWQFDTLTNSYFVLRIVNFAHNISYKLLDRGILEILGPLGLQTQMIRFTQVVSRLQSGLIFNYTLYILIFLVLFVCI